MQGLLGNVSCLAVPVSNSFFLANRPLRLQPKTIYFISKSITLQIMPALFWDGRGDTRQIPRGPALGTLPINLETRLLTQHSCPCSPWGRLIFFSGLIKCHSYAWGGEVGYSLLRPQPWTMGAFSYSIFPFPTDAFARCAWLGRFAGAWFFILLELGLADFSRWTYHALCGEQRFYFLFKGNVCFYILARIDEDRSGCLYHL